MPLIDVTPSYLVGKRCKVAYLSSDGLFDPNVQSGAGGLGVVTGSIRHALQRLGVDAVFIGTYSSHGYHRQVFRYVKDAQGKDIPVMVPVYEPERHPEAVLDTGRRFTLILAGRTCHVAIRTPAQIEQNHASVILLDTDIPENADEDFRMITRVLYGEGHASSWWDRNHEPWQNIDWLRGLQAAVLGLGAFYAMRELGIEAEFIHVNDSHPVFYLVHLLGLAMREGLSYEEALARVHATARYTNHTVLASGNKEYSIEKVVAPICGCYAGFDQQTLQRVSGSEHTFRMTSAALTLVGPGHANAVSKDHARLVSATFNYKFIPITNGVEPELYQHELFAELKDPLEIPNVKRKLKEIVFAMLCERSRDAGWDPRNVHLRDWVDPPLITWARRFQEYKRPGLMWYHKYFGLIRTLLEIKYVSTAWGGLAHPDDKRMYEAWNRYFNRFREVPNAMPVLNYRMDLMMWMKAATDLWLNTPRYGYEACGTSWMSALMNGGRPVSIADGGVIEATHVTLFGMRQEGEWSEQYEYDAPSLWRAVLPLVEKVRSRDPGYLTELYEGKLEAETDFSAARMVRDYSDLLWVM